MGEKIRYFNSFLFTTELMSTVLQQKFYTTPEASPQPHELTPSPRPQSTCGQVEQAPMYLQVVLVRV